MNPLALLAAPQRAAVALLGLAVVLGLAWIAWTWHGAAEYKRGKDEMQALVAAESAKITAAREAIGAARKEGADAALAKFTADKAELENRNVELAKMAADRGRALDRLRATAAAGAREVSIDSADPCRAPKLRAQAGDRLLAEGQRLAIEGAGLVDTLAGLVGEGEGALGSDAALIMLAKRWAEAVQIGASESAK